MDSWPTLAAYYASDPRRCGPREIELGGWWFDRPDEPAWRAVWNAGTGELYVVQVDDGGDAGPVELLATFATRAELDRALRGWWQVMGQSGAMGWLRRRLAPRQAG